MSELFKATMVYGIAPVMAKFAGVFLMPIYTRVFTPEEYGAITICASLKGIVDLFSNLNIHSGVAREYYEIKSEKEKVELISTGFWYIAFFSFFVLIIALYFSNYLSVNVLEIPKYKYPFIVVLISIPFGSILSYFNILMRFEKKKWFYTMSILMQLGVQIIFSLITILVFKWGIEGIFWGIIAGEVVAVIILLTILKKYIVLRVNNKLIKKVLIFSIPTLPAVLGGWINSSVSQIILLKYTALESVGFYSVALRLGSIFLLLGVAFRNAWTPFFYEQLTKKRHKEEFIKIYKFLLMLIFLLVITITIFAKPVILILSTKQYLIAYKLVGLICIVRALDFLKNIIGIGPQVSRKTIFMTISSIAGMAVNIISLFFLLPIYGVFGAPISLLFGGICTFILSWVFSFSLYPIAFPKRLTILYFVLSLFIYIVMVLSNGSVYLGITIEVIIMLILYNYYKKNILNNFKLNKLLFSKKK